jgi:lipoprotein-anchoring transpeptidase ErfK/SrfK
MKTLVGCFVFFFFFSFILVPNVLSSADRFNYLIKVKMNEKILILLSNGKQKKIYPIAVPRNKKYPLYPLPIVGEIKRIDLHPFWYPTERTRRDFLKKGTYLPRVIPPEHPMNAMGKARIILQFYEPPNDTLRFVRIHGTNRPDSIGQQVTRGCIRMLNEDILELSRIIENHLPVKVVFVN